MKKRKLIIALISLISLLFAILIFAVIFYKISLSPVSNSPEENITFIVEPGTPTTTIIQNLEKEGLIRNAKILKIYSKLHKGNLQAGQYIFTKAMSATEIYEKIINGEVTKDTVWITFVEGKRLTYFAKKISESFDYTYEEVMERLNDKEYIKELINKYDFLTEDILNEKIYYPLEGYLFPDTYEFLSSCTLDEIIQKLLDTTNLKFSPLSDNFKNSKYSIHQILTFASVIELEGAYSDDRNGIAGVIQNRLNSGWSLGCDATTYYGVKKEMGSGITQSDLRSCNGYNTRGTCVKGLPVGPIANSSLESVKAALNPTKHDYYYFVSDKNGKTYFTKTESEHQRKISELIKAELWLN